MNRWTPKLMEVARALCVVALVFLNFGHAPMAAGAGLSVTAGVASFCGAPVDPAGAPGKGPASQCDVCLIGAGLDLPPPPAGLPLHFGTEPVRYVLAAAVAFSACRHQGAQPRAPPALV